jgi:hypothetical protein
MFSFDVRDRDGEESWRRTWEDDEGAEDGGADEGGDDRSMWEAEMAAMWEVESTREWAAGGEPVVTRAWGTAREDETTSS